MISAVINETSAKNASAILANATILPGKKKKICIADVYM
jgi:hypothetical protein